MRREQRTPPLPATSRRPTARTSARVPGTLDVTRQPGSEQEDSRSAALAGEATAAAWGGSPIPYPQNPR